MHLNPDYFKKKANLLRGAQEFHIEAKSASEKILDKIIAGETLAEILPQVEQIQDHIISQLPRLASLSIPDIHQQYLQNREVIEKLIVLVEKNPNTDIANLDKVGITIRQLDVRCRALHEEQTKKISVLNSLDLSFTTRRLLKEGLVKHQQDAKNTPLISREKLEHDSARTKAIVNKLAHIKKLNSNQEKPNDPKSIRPD